MVAFLGNVYWPLPSCSEALDAGRRREPQRHVRRAQNVARHVADRSTAELREGAPVVRHVGRAVRARITVGQPGIPVERRRNGRFLRHHLRPLRPVGPRTIGPGVHFGDAADLARPDHLAALPRAFARVALVAHLRGHAVLSRAQRQLLRLPHRARQRLLAIHVLAARHGPHRRAGVHVVWTGYDHRVDVFSMRVEHAPEILVLRHVRVQLERLLGARVVGIGQRDDVLTGTLVNVLAGPASGPDRGDVQLLVGRFVAQALQRGSTAEAGEGQRAREQRAVEKVTSGESRVIHGLFVRWCRC